MQRYIISLYYYKLSVGLLVSMNLSFTKINSSLLLENIALICEKKIVNLMTWTFPIDTLPIAFLKNRNSVIVSWWL